MTMRVQPAILAGMVLVSKFWCEHCSLVIPDILAEGYYIVLVRVFWSRLKTDYLLTLVCGSSIYKVQLVQL